MEHNWTDQLGNYGAGEVECRNCGAYANYSATPYNLSCIPETNPFAPILPLEDADHVAGALGLTSDDIRRMK